MKTSSSSSLSSVDQNAASMSETLPNPNNESKFARLIKRFGVFGFFFFLGKGLLWLIVPYIISRFF